MKFDWRLNRALAGTAAVIASVVVAPAIVMALSGAEISKIAKEFTVMIDTQSPGSGVIFRKEGKNYYVLTAWHVVQYGDLKYAVKTFDDQRHPIEYSKVKRVPGVDLAVVEFTSDQKYSTAEFANSDQLSEGTPVYIAGFPDPGADIQERIYKFTNGDISGIYHKPLSGGYALVYTNITRTGFSGGPVLDANAHVVGIHGQGEASEQQSGGGRSSSTGFNRGIPSKTFIDLAPQIGMRVSYGSSGVSSNSPIVTTPPDAISAPGALPTRPGRYRSQTDTDVCAGSRC